MPLAGCGQPFTVYLADTDDSISYRQADYSGRTALVVGSERYGISPPWYEQGFGRIGIPMLGAADSLNVSVSASVLLYEAAPARTAGEPCSPSLTPRRGSATPS